MGVVGLVVGALVGQGCSDVESPDGRDGAVAGVAAGTPQIAADSQELPVETPVSGEENPSEADELSEEEIYCPPTSSSLGADPGFVSLDERILRSTIIARATMRSVSAATRQDYYPPKRYNPMMRFTFDVHEYLKGNGGDVITADVRVRCGCPCPDDSEQEAVDYANDWISREAASDPKASRSWEGGESIIFLEEDELGRSEASGQVAATMYKFIPWNEYRYPIYNYASTYEPYFGGDTYSILSERNRVWLPRATSSSASGADESRFMLGNRPKDVYGGAMARSSWFATDISLSDLKSRINAVADMVKQSGGWAGYEECLRAKFRWFRMPYGPYPQEFRIRAAASAGSVVDSRRYSGDEYDIFFLEGDDKRFFEVDIEDADDDPVNGYSRRLKITRPLARGDYSVRYHHLPGFIRPCIDASAGGRRDFPVGDETWTIRATAPAGTLHEAFFDPVSIFDPVTSGAAVGADGDNGMLTPAAFSATGSPDAEIRRVDWRADVVKIEIADMSASIVNHHIDFIELDGSILLRLDFDDAVVADAEAVRTFSWIRCGLPWQAGDKVMLRIRESPADLEGATNLTSCSDAATPTPSPAMTPTPEGSAASQ